MVHGFIDCRYISDGNDFGYFFYFSERGKSAYAIIKACLLRTIITNDIGSMSELVQRKKWIFPQRT